MTKQDKQDLVSILTTMEGICKRHYPNHNGCPFYHRLFCGCSFYSILYNGFKTSHIDLVKLKNEMKNANQNH